MFFIKNTWQEFRSFKSIALDNILMLSIAFLLKNASLFSFQRPESLNNGFSLQESISVTNTAMSLCLCNKFGEAQSLLEPQ